MLDDLRFHWKMVDDSRIFALAVQSCKNPRVGIPETPQNNTFPTQPRGFTQRFSEIWGRGIENRTWVDVGRPQNRTFHT